MTTILFDIKDEKEKEKSNLNNIINDNKKSHSLDVSEIEKKYNYIINT